MIKGQGSGVWRWLTAFYIWGFYCYYYYWCYSIFSVGQKVLCLKDTILLSHDQMSHFQKWTIIHRLPKLTLKQCLHVQRCTTKCDDTSPIDGTTLWGVFAQSIIIQTLNASWQVIVQSYHSITILFYCCVIFFKYYIALCYCPSTAGQDIGSICLIQIILTLYISSY